MLIPLCGYDVYHFEGALLIRNWMKNWDIQV